MAGPSVPPPLPPAGGSLTDLLTTAKNLVTAVNELARSYLNVEGLANQSVLTGPTLIKSGRGRVVMVSVTTVGAAVGYIYDTTLATSTDRPIYVIQNTLGVTRVNLPISYGLVVAPGSGQTLTVSYS